MAVLGHPPVGAAASLLLVCMTCRHPLTQVQSHSACAKTADANMEMVVIAAKGENCFFMVKKV